MIPQFRKEYEVYFFGKNKTADLLRAEYPHSCHLKQTHSDILVPAHPTLQIGDAHWTQDVPSALVIQTADCLPVMMYAPSIDTVIAIHAGWRGVEKRIVTKSLKSLNLGRGDEIDVLIGPHIQQESFEADEDVATAILKAHGQTLDSTHCFKRGSKYHIQLSALVINEIQHDCGLRIENLFLSDIDTKTHPDYYSFRDGDRGGRNFSLINKKSAD